MTETKDVKWYKDAIIYQVHVKTFFDSNGDGVGDFNGLISKLDYIKDLGVTAIWLLPFYPSPLKDDGYDISDYRKIHPQYGTLADFKIFLHEAHKRDLKVITELVINHTSDQHPWFQASRTAPKDSKLRNFYVWSDTPDKYKEARINFQDFEHSNWSWDPVAKQYFWHRFYSHQPDLNFENQDVQKEIFKVLDYWFEMGVDGMRLDAIPYLFQKEDTNCENLPETHQFLKKLRAHVDTKFKGKMLLAEANQWPEDAVEYFGNGDECHMAFHFPLMPRIFMSVQMEDRFPIIDILESTPQIPEGCQWAIFLRNHDELTLEMVTDEERDYMYKMYARDKRARVNVGIRRRLAPLMGNDKRKIELVNILLLTLPGTPIIYYGDEIGMGDNFYLGDRNGVRTPMQWDGSINAGFSKANPQQLYLPPIIDPQYHHSYINVENQLAYETSLLWWMKKAVAIRKSLSGISDGRIEFLHPDNTNILAFIRSRGEEEVLVAVNLSRYPQTALLDLSLYKGRGVQEVFGGSKFPAISDDYYQLNFAPYGYNIFLLKKDKRKIEKVDTLELKSIKELQEVKSTSILEQNILPSFFDSASWFLGKSKDLREFKIRESFNTDGGESLNFIVDLTYKGGLSESYFVPVSWAFGEETKNLGDKFPQAKIADLRLNGERGIIYDAAYNKQWRKSLLNMLLNKKTVKTSRSKIVASTNNSLENIFANKTSDLSSKIVGSRRSSTSLVFEDILFLKIFRKLEVGIHPQAEIENHLADQGFNQSPRVLGRIDHIGSEQEEMSLALLEEYIRNEGNAWQLALSEVSRFYDRVLSKKGQEIHLEPPKSILDFPKKGFSEETKSLVGSTFLEQLSSIGARVAEFHTSLVGDDENFAPQDFSYIYQIAFSQFMVSYYKRVLQQAVGRTNLSEEVKKEISLVNSNKEKINSTIKKLQYVDIKLDTIRIHGDMQLEELLYTGKDFVIIDVEGDPVKSINERRLKRPSLLDVAGLLRSLHYAAYVSLFKQRSFNKEELIFLEDWADVWYRITASTLLHAYLENLGESKLIPKKKEALEVLLDALLLTKAFRELEHEINNRPDWSVIPARGIKYLLGLEG